MTPHGPARFTLALASLALAMAAASARAHGAYDVPAELVLGACKPVDFEKLPLLEPAELDFVVQVDEAGSPLSVKSLKHTAPEALIAAYTESIMTCSFHPALASGKPVPGAARVIYNFPGIKALQSPPGTTSSVDPQRCMPTSDDYPEASRRLDESGTTKLRFTLEATGRLTSYFVVKSSGHPRLDFASMAKLARCKFAAPASALGKHRTAYEVDFVWKLD